MVREGTGRAAGEREDLILVEMIAPPVRGLHSFPTSVLADLDLVNHKSNDQVKVMRIHSALAQISRKH